MEAVTENPRVTIFDTTLRDGEQSPGASMNLAQKLQLARALKELGVDVIELGFPVASPGDFEAVRAVARQVEGPILCALARAHRKDIDRTWEALREAPRKRLHVFLATSPLHRQFKLQMSKEEVLARSVEAVRYGRERFEDVEFSAEDASRTEPEFLCEVVERVIEAGATTINIPDTVGYAVPDQLASCITQLKREVRGIERVVLSVHCHDDLGLAVANSLAALSAGARQVECTINGIGERAGNCALEELVMALRTRSDRYGLRTGIQTARLYPVSQLLARVTGLQVSRNKAVVGRNAFAHEAGIHQHGVLQNAATYEIMRPEDVGFASNQLVLGKHSGRHLLQRRLQELGYDLAQEPLDKIFAEFKALADKKKEIYEADLEALVVGHVDVAPRSHWQLVSLSTVSGTSAVPSAAICLQGRDGKQFRDAACGDGPVDAIFQTIERITGISATLCDYQVSSVTVGEDAQGEIVVDVEYAGERFRGRAVNTDIVLGSAQAYLQAINRAAARRSPQPIAGVRAEA